MRLSFSPARDNHLSRRVRKAVDGDAGRRHWHDSNLAKDSSCHPERSSLKPAPTNLNFMKSLLKPSLTAFSLLLPSQLLLAQETTDYTTSAGGGSPVPGIIGLLIGLLIIVAIWKIFTKAGQPGWASIIPIYNLYIWCKIVGRPWWWILLMLIPFVNFIVGIILCIDLAKSFGKGAGFGIGLALLGVIFFPILGFGSAQYQGAAATPKI